MGKRLTRVLLVDDDKSFLNQTGKYLKEHYKDIDVNITLSAKEALQQLTEQEYDIVVSGYKMTEMDGIEFLGELRKRNFDIPFILFTSEGGEKVILDAFRKGVDDYVARRGDKKSYHSELAHSIDQILGRKEEEEEKYRVLVDNIPDFVYLIDEEYRVLSLNRSATEIFDAEPQEIVGKSIYDLFPEEIADTFREGIDRAFKTGRSRTSDGRMVVKGKEFLTTTSLNAIRDSGGKIVAVLGVTRDVTRDKKIEGALRETERRLLTIIENLGAGLGITDKNGILTYVNPLRARMLGYSPREMIGNPSTTFIHKDSLAHWKNEMTKRKRGKTSTYELNLVSKDERIIPVLTIGTPLFDEEGQYTGSYGLTIDLTERKEMEQALRTSEERYRTLVELAHDGIMMTEGPELTIRFVNRKMGEILGYPVKQLSGRKFIDLVHPDEKEEAIRNMETSLASGEGDMYARRLVGKDGSTLDTLISSSIITPENKTESSRLILIVTDITDSIRAREALTQVSGRIQDLEKEISGLRETFPSDIEQESRKTIEMADLLQLPDHLRGTLVALSDMRKATASEVAEKTGKVRNIESVYLNQLERMGLLDKSRKGRRIYFRIRSTGGRSVRRVLRQLYQEGR
jgi:PAS domain S-box-containing protein